MEALHKIISLRKDLFPQVTNAYRVIHRKELPNFDIAFDRYADWGCLWIYNELEDQESALTHYQQIISFLIKNLNLKGIVIKAPQRDPHNKKLIEFQKNVGTPPPPYFTVYEHGLHYKVSLTESQHIGLFLDQRDNRKLLLSKAKNKRVLNLFSYTCSFSVVAAKAECEVVFSIDVANPCLQTGKDNFDINSLTEKNCGKFIKEDVRTWLKKQLKKQEKGNFVPFDIIICDPPVFAKSKKEGHFSVEKEWSFLSESCAKLLSPNGFAFFSNNHRSGHGKKYFQELKKHFKNTIVTSPPLDFPDIYQKQEKHIHMFQCCK